MVPSWCKVPVQLWRWATTEDALPSLLFYDTLSHHAYVFLFVSVNLEADLSTQEEMPT